MFHLLNILPLFAVINSISLMNNKNNYTYYAQAKLSRNQAQFPILLASVQLVSEFLHSGSLLFVKFPEPWTVLLQCPSCVSLGIPSDHSTHWDKGLLSLTADFNICPLQLFTDGSTHIQTIYVAGHISQQDQNHRKLHVYSCTISQLRESGIKNIYTCKNVHI